MGKIYECTSQSWSWTSNILVILDEEQKCKFHLKSKPWGFIKRVYFLRDNVENDLAEVSADCTPFQQIYTFRNEKEEVAKVKRHSLESGYDVLFPQYN